MAAYRASKRSKSIVDQDNLCVLDRHDLREVIAKVMRHTPYEVLGESPFRRSEQLRAMGPPGIATVAVPDGATWIDIKDAAKLFGMTHTSIKNAITRETFPVLTYKLGKKRVIDRDVLEAYFAARKSEGMAKWAAMRAAAKNREKR